MAEDSLPKTWRWYHALLFWAVVNLAQYTALGGDPSSYAQLKQAPFAPPAWVFGPAWFCLNILVLWGNLRLLNQHDLRHRHTLLGLQALSWLIYATFAFVNFQLKSPVLAFAWTFAMWFFTLSSMLLAWKGDRKITFSLLPLLLWLSFATALASYQMLYNQDPLFGRGMMQHQVDFQPR